MTDRPGRWALVTIATIVLLAPVPAGAQGGSSPAISRTPDSRPDLTGIWQVMNNAAWNIQDQNAAPGPQPAPWIGIPASRGVVEGNEIPYQAWARRSEERRVGKECRARWSRYNE